MEGDGEFLGFGGSRLAVQQQDAGPGPKADGREAELEPGGVDGEQAGWAASETGGPAVPDAVLDGGVSTVADLQELGRAAGVTGRHGCARQPLGTR
ncbi:hypothetical protein [Streptomyces sp. NPDC059802]|uniref:hypothetical protein n=1 Tax=Streptomyces sp. NPDC059802 TaxID=3346952 RepID=UPI003652A101